jgi:hypothetical protein
MSKSQIATGGIADDAVSTAKVLNDSRIVTPLIINGDMAVAQRATSASGLGASSGYNTCDRWNFEKEGSPSARFTQSQDTDVPTGQGFTTSLKMDCTTAAGSPDADDAISIQQKIEAQDLQLLRYGTSSAKKVTLSFWVKATKTGTNAIWIYQNDDNRSQAQTYTVNSSNTWEKKVVVFAADTTGVIDNNNGEGFRINWWLTAGSNFTSGTLSTTWQSHVAANNAVGQVNNADSTSNNWYITGVQLEVGEFDSDTIPPFPFESFSNNLHKCRRYFVKSPKTDGLNHYSLHDMFTYDNSNCYAGYIFNPPMRAAPTISQTTAAEFLTNGTDKSITTDMLYSSQKDNETARIRFYDGNAFSDQNGKVGILQNGTFKFESEL